MNITFDPAKRAKTLDERGLDFASAGAVFEGKHFTREDDRFDYGERRFISIGRLGESGRMVVIVWTPRGDARHVISMRKANEREQRRYAEHLLRG